MRSLRQALELVEPIEPVLSVRKWADIIVGKGKPFSLGTDSDLDGLPDFWEQVLAEAFAPIVYHSRDESNFPTNVEWFLPKTELRFYDDDCTTDLDQLVVPFY